MWFRLIRALLAARIMTTLGCNPGLYLRSFTDNTTIKGIWGHDSPILQGNTWNVTHGGAGGNRIYTECCDLAPAGWYSAGGAPGVGVLMPCSLGHYCPVGSAAPIPCPAGTYGNVTGLMASDCSGSCQCCNAGSIDKLDTGTCSQTPTYSQSSTLSASLTQSASQTATLTSSPSLSTSMSPSQSQSISASETVTSTSTVTASLTQSPSLSPSPSLTQTRSSTSTRSVTQSQSASLTTSASQSQSLSQTQTATQSGTSSGTSSASLSSTPSGTLSSTVTQSSSQTRTTSQTQTVTTSLRPFELDISLVVEGTTLLLSDSLPSVQATVNINRCPDMWRRAFLVCSVAPVGQSLTLSGRVGSLQVLVELSQPGYFDVPCASDAYQPVLLPVTLTLGAAFGTAGGAGLLECELVAGTVHVARGTLPLLVRPTMWPLWGDGLIVAPSLSTGQALYVRSTRLQYNINVTGELVAAFCAPVGSLSTACNAHDASLGSQAVFSAVQATWGVVSLPRPTSATVPFTATLVGPQRIVLRASDPNSPIFSQDTNVLLGGVACSFEVSADGTWLLFTAPTPEALCNSSTVDCGYTPLVVSNPPAEAAAPSAARLRTLASEGQVVPPPHLGAELSCPPFCAGSTGLSIPVAAPSGFVLASPPADSSSLPRPLPASALGSTTSQGFYYASACEQTGFYVSPSLGSCSNATSPESYGCAWGSGSSCTLCPSGAVCPGGSRLWSRSGYWLASEGVSPSGLLQCAPPDPTARCLGWDAFSASTICGRGYRQGSYLCGACAPGYFYIDDGSCSACPAVESLWARFSGLIYIFAAVFALVAAFYGVFRVIRWAAGAPGTGGGLLRLLNLGIWALMVAQVISDVAVASNQSLPPYLSALYNHVVVLQLQGGLLPAACTGAYPFENHAFTMGAAIGLWTVTAAIFYGAPPRAGITRLCGQLALLGAFLLYANASYTAVSVLNCSTITISPAGAAGLDGGARAAASAPAAIRGIAPVVSVDVLVSNPSFVCWEAAGKHRAVGVLAIVTLIWYVAGMPIATLIWLARDAWLRDRKRVAAVELAAKGRRVYSVDRSEFDSCDNSSRGLPPQLGAFRKPFAITRGRHLQDDAHNVIGSVKQQTAHISVARPHNAQRAYAAHQIESTGPGSAGRTLDVVEGVNPMSRTRSLATSPSTDDKVHVATVSLSGAPSAGGDSKSASASTLMPVRGPKGDARFEVESLVQRRRSGDPGPNLPRTAPTSSLSISGRRGLCACVRTLTPCSCRWIRRQRAASAETTDAFVMQDSPLRQRGLLTTRQVSVPSPAIMPQPFVNGIAESSASKYDHPMATSNAKASNFPPSHSHARSSVRQVLQPSVFVSDTKKQRGLSNHNATYLTQLRSLSTVSTIAADRGIRHRIPFDPGHRGVRALLFNKSPAILSHASDHDNDAAEHAGNFTENPVFLSAAGPVGAASVVDTRGATTPTSSPSIPPYPSTDAALPPDPVLQVFFFDYRPAAGWFMRHVELMLLLTLSILRALLPWPVTLSGIIVKTSISVSALLFALVTVIWVRPFLASEAWMGWVRALLLLDSVFCVLLNAAAGAASLGLGGSTLASALSTGSIACFACCMSTFAVLLLGVAYHVYSDARAEKRRADAAELRARRRVRMQHAHAAASSDKPMLPENVTESNIDGTLLTPLPAHLDNSEKNVAHVVAVDASVDAAASTHRVTAQLTRADSSRRSLVQGALLSMRRLAANPQLAPQLSSKRGQPQ